MNGAWYWGLHFWSALPVSIICWLLCIWKRKSKPNLEGQWAGAKSFSAFHQYFIWRGIEGQGMKGTKTHIHAGICKREKKRHTHTKINNSTSRVRAYAHSGLKYTQATSRDINTTIKWQQTASNERPSTHKGDAMQVMNINTHSKHHKAGGAEGEEKGRHK